MQPEPVQMSTITGCGGLLRKTDCRFHDQFGFRPRNQHIGRYPEFQAPEFLSADDVLKRLPACPPLDQILKQFSQSRFRALHEYA